MLRSEIWEVMGGDNGDGDGGIEEEEEEEEEEEGGDGDEWWGMRQRPLTLGHLPLRFRSQSSFYISCQLLLE
ncbi:hypothetical protein Ancab_025533 [Ancistrocladus abbreviatus]